MNKWPGTLILLFMTSLPLHAADLPPDFSARYGVYKYSNRVAEMQLTLKHQDESILYRSHSKPKGLAALLTDQEIDETSKLRAGNATQALRLIEYRYTHRKKARKNQAYTVSYPSPQTASVKGDYGSHHYEITAEAPVWDRLSVQLALIKDVRDTLSVGDSFNYNIVDDGKIEHYVFEYRGKAVVKIDERNYQSLLFRRVHGKRTTSLWLASELHYLPAKIEQQKDGDLDLRMLLEKTSL